MFICFSWFKFFFGGNRLLICFPDFCQIFVRIDPPMYFLHPRHSKHFQKSPKKPSKTRFKQGESRVEKQCFFRHPFFRVLALIWDHLGLQNGSQVGDFGLQNASKGLKRTQDIPRCPKDVPKRTQDASKRPPRAPKGAPWELPLLFWVLLRDQFWRAPRCRFRGLGV